MNIFKEKFENSYGQDSFNEDFLIDAISAENIHQQSMVWYRDKLDIVIEAVEMFKLDLKINPLSADFESLECILNFISDNIGDIMTDKS